MTRPIALRALACCGVVLVLLAHVTARAAPAVHVVRRGETLSGLAARYGVSQTQLTQWNRLRSATLLVGQRLTLGPDGQPDSVHVVRRGETLSGIAARFRISQAQLKRLNGLQSDVVRSGQRLVIAPAAVPQAAPPPAAKATAGAKPAVEAGPAAGAASTTPSDPGPTVTHRVRRGEHLTGIAAHRGTTVARLRALNRLSSDKLLVGQRLQVPQAPSAPAPVAAPAPSAALATAAAPPALVVSPAGTDSSADAPEDSLASSGAATPQDSAAHQPEPAASPTPGGLDEPPPRTGPQPRTAAVPPAAPRRHTVRRGEHLTGIALRYGTSVEQLRALNGLHRDTVRPGQRLVVCDSAEDADEEGPAEYTVRPGDTLGDIAKRHEVGLRLLRSLNGLTSDTIRPGQRLRLRPSLAEESVHVVQQGETLSGIAARYGLSLATLSELNALSNSKILVGQKLRLRQPGRATHLVERGDALWEIAQAYGMSIAELRELNGLTSDRIYPGQELLLSSARAQRYWQYRVRAGDNLAQIARLHQMTVSELRQLNQLQGSLIRPGQRLRVRPLLGQGDLASGVTSWPDWCAQLPGLRTLSAPNGPYFTSRPRAARQRSRHYFEGQPQSPLATYRRASELFRAFDRRVGELPRLSNLLEGWHVVVDPGHGGLDPGAIVEAVDDNGDKLYVTEDEYVYDLALRVYTLLRLHGAQVSLTVLSPNHLIRGGPAQAGTFVHQKNEVYNSFEYNQADNDRAWPAGGNLRTRVQIAREALAGAPRGRRVFLSLHSDIDPRSPEAPLVLYYASREGRRVDLASRAFARTLLPYLGAGARTRGQALGVLRDNPADFSVLLELRNMAYRDHVWAIRFEELRHRDAEKVVQSLLAFAEQRSLSAQR